MVMSDSTSTNLTAACSLIAPGIWKITLGEPEELTPVRCRFQPPAPHLEHCPAPGQPPFDPERITGLKTRRGYLVSLPLEADEELYGLGLQLKSFAQRGKKKTLRVNSDPTADLGDSHAPVPWYVSTAGYGVLVDTARYATFHLGSTRRLASLAPPTETGMHSMTSAPALYEEAGARGQGHEVLVEVPSAGGMDIFLFAGPTMCQAVERYVLFSGGGCVPPRWGLGWWYRAFGQARTEDVVALGEEMRQDAVPCDVMGLEPGWQTQSYPCSFMWSERFPNPARFLQAMGDLYYRVNLWTHAFTAPQAPMAAELTGGAGDFTAFDGLVPDLMQPTVRQSLGHWHEQEQINLGVSGFKLDECDNSDFIVRPWSFPECSSFPSGADGEQMHSLFGLAYQETLDQVFRRKDQRAYHEVRNTHALAARYPFVLYSDLYDHRDFVRGVANCGFSGILWCPELRHATSLEELVRRLQAVALSPQALTNGWYIKHPPWQQWETERNNAGDLRPDRADVTALCRRVLELRMRLIPYLSAAYFKYHLQGTPPFRALALDWPQESALRQVDDQWMIGDRLMAAPVVAGDNGRSVVLPPGSWVNFWTGEVLEGNQKLALEVPLDQVPLFVQNGTLLPLAQPTLHTADPLSRRLTVQVYGNGNLAAELIEDDDATFAFSQGQFNRLLLRWDATAGKGTASREGEVDLPRYKVSAWEQITPSRPTDS